MTEEELEAMEARAKAVTGAGASAVWCDVKDLVAEVRTLRLKLAAWKLSANKFEEVLQRHGLAMTFRLKPEGKP